MKLLINIPKEFEQHFQADRFEDSLHRLSADAHLLAGNYEQEIAMMLIKSFKSAVPVPKHGRLIDGDALADKMIIADEPKTVSEHINNIVQFMRSLADAPTVIPSNKEEET